MSKRMSTRRVSSSRGRPTKQRRTFTLSPESIELLEELSRPRNGRQPESVSAVLDSLLRSVRQERRRQENERLMAKYYDERSKKEEEEEIAWGKLALANFPVDDSPEEGRR